MSEHSLPPTRHAPAMNLPPYAYVPGHGLPHPVNDPDGHLYATRDSGDSHPPPISSVALAALPSGPDERRRALAAVLARNHAWLHALDLFNAGFYWEAHEAWEAFWHALGRVTPEARFIQGLIHLAAACVKIREGRPAGVASHTLRARELMGELTGTADGGEGGERSATLGIVPESLAAVFAELENSTPECWHTSRVPVVKVLVAGLAIVSSSAGSTQE
jgi:hypothetical protein